MFASEDMRNMMNFLNLVKGADTQRIFSQMSTQMSTNSSSEDSGDTERESEDEDDERRQREIEMANSGVYTVIPHIFVNSSTNH